MATYALFVAVIGLTLTQVLASHDHCAERKGNCCEWCKPGFYIHDKCGHTPCKPCPANGYMNRNNNEPTCYRCRRCEGVFEYNKTCTPTSNAECYCRAKGSRCYDEKCSACTGFTCPPGSQVGESDCEPCPPGTFKEGDNKEECIPWRLCNETSQERRNGSDIKDAKCFCKNSAEECADKDCSHCVPSCPAGAQYEKGSCVPCPHGSYKQSKGSKACVPWTACNQTTHDQLGGTATNDARCYTKCTCEENRDRLDILEVEFLSLSFKLTRLTNMAKNAGLITTKRKRSGAGVSRHAPRWENLDDETPSNKPPR